MPVPNGQRQPYWDNFKGVLIVLVVLGHYLWEYRASSAIREIVYAIYVFHMPAFVFASGYFSRSPRSVGGKALTKLVLLYLALNFSMMFYGKYVENQPFSLVDPYYSSWYLLALFLYRLTLGACRRIPAVIPLSVGLSLAVGFVWRTDGFFQLQKIIALYPFFIAGAQLTSERCERLVARLRRRPGVAWTALLLLAALLLWLAHRQTIGTREVMWVSYDHPLAVLTRLLVLALATAMIGALLALTPQRPSALVTRWGRNSLLIYLAHRIFTLLLAHYFPQLGATPAGGAWLAAAAFATLLALGTDALSQPFNRGLERVVETLQVWRWIGHPGFWLAGLLFVAGFGAGALAARGGPAPLIAYARTLIHPAAQQSEQDLLHPLISARQQAILDDTVSLAFVGDLILLRDQVFKARNERTGQYDYDPLFAYARPYLRAADLTLGVFEGPMAGDEVEYSTSSYDDKIPLYLNFPDAFARSVKAAGIDFVTLANNHLLDRGVPGALRTLDVLDQVGLAHSGSYRSAEDKAARDIPVIDVKGLKVAILTYTYGSNYYPTDYFFDPSNAFRTSILVDPQSPRFAQVKQSILDDFRRARAKNPDTIVVMPHMGKQFQHVPDAFQKAWVEFFVGAGADVVFSDHPHAVQPIEWRSTGRSDRKFALIVHCPGNFVNSYTAQDGDAMAIVEARLQRKSGAPVAASVVPMWAQATMNGSPRALPIERIMHDAQLQQEISNYDLARVQQVHALITRIMLGRELSVDQIQPRYFLFPEGYARARVTAIEPSEQMKGSQLYKLLAGAASACFIGDSLTAGTKNGGYGWYEPLAAAFPGLAVERRAWGSHTIKMLLARKDEIVDCHADVYVIAVGTNDVRYRSEKNSAMNAAEYVVQIDRLLAEIGAANPRARFVLIGAWTTDHYDPVSVLGEAERMAMLEEYRQALRAYAAQRGHLYIDPNPGIERVLRSEYPPIYLKDHIHPNADQGIRLYSAKVLEASP